MLQEFFAKLRNKDVDFEDTIHVINTLYDYQPTRFANGITTVVMNEAGQNEGSCRIFAFALLNNLNEQETLACFGRFYQEVLNDPQGSSHGNIRNFMRDGWAGISFEGKALTAKRKHLAEGSTGTASMTVTDMDTAKAIAVMADDDFPEVFATARMVGLMELAAARCLKVLLNDGELSVGVGVDIQHLAATPKYEVVQAVATYLGKEGKLYKFTIEAFDAGGKIGEGTHTRAIISTERLVAGAKARVALN